ncbi:hypothetical protein RUND412_005449 [Rhizina undulata]
MTASRRLRYSLIPPRKHRVRLSFNFINSPIYPPKMSSFIAPLRRSLLRHSAPRIIRPLVASPRFIATTPVHRLQGLAGASKFQEQPRLRLGTVAPNFEAETTHGKVDFHEFIGDHWAILFSHPADFTPVCTTELGAFAKLVPEFTKRNTKLIGLSANNLESHAQWIRDIDEVTGSKLAGGESGGPGKGYAGHGVGGRGGSFPIIADESREVAWLYDMVDAQDLTNIDEKGIAFTIRSVYIIDPNKKIRLIMTYPASTGRNTWEVLRVLDSLQTVDKHGIATPINWQVGDDVIVPPSIQTEDAVKKFGEENIRVLKPYLRYTKLKE